MTGKVYLVGAGPGDPGLLTLRGREALEAADCVIYDRLANPVLLEFAPSWAERIFAGKYGGHGGGNCMSQQEIHRLMISHARAGEVVVRLKGGDPFLFGRGGEEAEVLADAGIPWQVVPGVSSALANLGKIAAHLVAHGRPATTPAAVIEWGTYRRQKVAVGTLEDIARLAGDLGMGPPVTLVAGEAAAMGLSLRAPMGTAL